MPKASAEGVKMRIVVINPSSEKTQTKDVKKYLPKEVSLKDIRDAGGIPVSLGIVGDEAQLGGGVLISGERRVESHARHYDLQGDIQP